MSRLCAAYWRHAEHYYRHPDGEPPRTDDKIKQALKVLRRLYGSVRVSKYGPLALQATRQAWIGRELARNTINGYVSAIKQMFKWGVANDLVPETTYRALTAVSGLAKGRSEARDPAPKKPGPEAHVSAIETFASDQVWAIIRLQIATAARAGELLKMRSVGRPPRKPIVMYENFCYQAGSWNKSRRVVAKIEWHREELFPRVGFIVTNLSWSAKKVVRYYNQRGTAEQWIREGKNAVKWTRLSCHDFADNEVRLQLFALAYNLGNFLRRLVLPRSMRHWTLTTLREKLIKIGAKVVTHSRYVTFQMAGPCPESCSPPSWCESGDYAHRNRRRDSP